MTANSTGKHAGPTLFASGLCQLSSEDNTKDAGRTSKFQTVLISGFVHWILVLKHTCQHSRLRMWLPPLTLQHTWTTIWFYHLFTDHSFIQTSWLIPLGWCHQEDLKSGPCSQGEGKRLQTSHWSGRSESKCQLVLLKVRLIESRWISVYLSVEGENHLPYTVVYIKPLCVYVCVCVCVCVCVSTHLVFWRCSGNTAFSCP